MENPIKKKLVVFPTDPVENYAKKGEVKKGYYNPDNYFDEVNIITFSDRDSNIDYSKIGGMCGKAKCKLHFVGKFSFLKISQLKKRVIEAITKIQPDAIRAYDLLFQGYFASKAAKKLNVPFVLSLHDNYEEYFKFAWSLNKSIPKWVFFKIWNAFFLKSILNSTTYVIGAYPHTLNGIPKINIPHEVIYNKVYSSIFKPMEVSKETNFTAITVANLLPMKGVSLLVDAIKETDINLIIVGRGPMKEQLKKQAEKNNVSAQVKFIEALSNTELPNLYNSVHCFVTAIRQGGIGIPMIEAMACGIPLIYAKPKYTDQPDVYDGENMLLVDDTLECIRQGLITFKNDPGLREMIAAKGLESFQEIEGTKMEKREAEVYKRVLSK